MARSNTPSIKFKQSNAQRMREQRAWNKLNKRFYCKRCNIAYGEASKLRSHLKGSKHNGGYSGYECQKCEFRTMNEFNGEIHRKTEKHKRNSEK